MTHTYSAGHQGITISNGALSVPTRVPTDEVLSAMRSHGISTDGLNSMSWPLGVSKWAEGRFLITAEDLAKLTESEDKSPEDEIQLTMGSLTFSRLWLLPPEPVFVNDMTGVVYVVTLADDRWRWRDVFVTQKGFNVTSTDDRTSIDDDTDDAGSPYNIADVITLLRELLPDTSAPEWLIPGSAEDPDLDSDVSLRDLITKGMPVPVLIDRLAALAGDVVICLPHTSGYAGLPNGNLDDVPVDGYRYLIRSIGDGLDHAEAFFERERVHFMAGGMLSYGSEYSPASRMARLIGGASGYLEQMVPGSVTVKFPTDYRPGHPDYITDRFSEVSETTGIPAGVTGGAQGVTVHASTWATMNGTSTPTNQTALNTEAAEISERYYRRFRCGACRVVMRELVRMVPWAGAQRIRWVVDPNTGPMTFIDGEFHPQLFGFRHDMPLKTHDVFSIGMVRSYPRPDGALLLDSPGQPALFPVEVRQEGGSAGNSTTQCSFTYSVRNLHGTVLGDTVTTPIQPQRLRTSVGLYVAPPDDTVGLAYYDEGGNLKLWHANEVPSVQIC